MAGIQNNAPYLGPSGYVHKVHVHTGTGQMHTKTFRTYESRPLSEIRDDFEGRLHGLLGCAHRVFLFDLADMHLPCGNLTPAVNHSAFVKGGFTSEQLLRALNTKYECAANCSYGHEGHPAFHWIAVNPDHTMIFNQVA